MRILEIALLVFEADDNDAVICPSSTDTIEMIGELSYTYDSYV
jgi:hypothetical protein